MLIVGFDWDEGNSAECQKHGVMLHEIEFALENSPMTFNDTDHSDLEERFRAIGINQNNRPLFIVFTIREKDDNFYYRPLSARFMHQKEVNRYVEKSS